MIETTTSQLLAEIGQLYVANACLSRRVAELERANAALVKQVKDAEADDAEPSEGDAEAAGG